jgi:hypothetical protein
MREYFYSKVSVVMKWCALAGCFLLLSLAGRAQVTATEKHRGVETEQQPRNIKVLDEHKDSKGNTVRVIQYEQKGQRITETMTIPPKENINTRVRINPDTINTDSVLVIVNKSKFNVEVLYRHRLIRYYKAVFGPKPLEDKKVAGDRCTPEGWFTIQNKNPSSKYHKFLLLNYPNDSTIARFNIQKARGTLPASAKIGGDIGIHGIWKGGDDMIEMGVCWTDGCIALRNKDVEELYSLVGVGTRVYIRK